MRRSLNGWQRIGIILSVIWLLMAGVSSRRSDVQQAYAISYGVCFDKRVQQSTQDFSNCMKEAPDAFHAALGGSWENVAAIGLLPIPFGWVLGWLAIRLFRWIKHGFETSTAR